MKKTVFPIILVLMLVMGNLSAQDMMDDVPSVSVREQLSLDGTVTIDAVYSEGYGFVVIHADNGEGAFDEAIGSKAINAGWNHNVNIEINTRQATPQLFAMLHHDTGEIGVYEFAGEGTPDVPVFDADGNIITPAFNVHLIDSNDQIVEENTVTINAVTSQDEGWLIVHAGDAEGFGEVLGATRVSAGTTLDVVVELEGMITDILYPMLHVNTGDLDLYEFAGEGTPDGPIVIDGAVATLPIWTVPHLRVNPQTAIYADNSVMMMDVPSLHIESVLSVGEGWVIIHADDNGTFGEVVGMTRVGDGLTTDLNIELSANATPVLWPMLHENTGDLDIYEFAGEGTPDVPMVVDGAVVTFPVEASPSIAYDSATIDEDGVVRVDNALIDAHGWLIIHADTDGTFGEVIGMTQLYNGVNSDIRIQTEGLSAGDTVWLMLHYDTGELGYYGFAGADTEDDPVILNGEVVTAPVTLSASE